MYGSDNGGDCRGDGGNSPGDGDSDGADDTSGLAAKVGRGGGGGGEAVSLLGRLFPWRNCHGGAWNKTLLISHTRVRIE
jgi:hypothetical protein